MPSYEMRPFAMPEAERVASWAKTPEDAHDLCGSRETLTAEDVVAWTYEADYCFTLRWDGELVAYGEIVEDVVENDVEIQHLLVAPDMRSVGVGKALLSRLCAFLAGARPYEEVWLRVGRENVPAAACACAVGFENAAGMSGPRYLWMRMSLITP